LTFRNRIEALKGPAAVYDANGTAIPLMNIKETMLHGDLFTYTPPSKGPLGANVKRADRELAARVRTIKDGKEVIVKGVLELHEQGQKALQEIEEDHYLREG